MSLIFLLYGDNPLNAKFGLQRLLILYHGQHTQTTDLQKWIISQNDPDWRLTIIEALWTIKAKYVLRKLGLHLEALYERFVDSSNAEINLKIHPILKGLYCIIEKIDPADAKQLINYVNTMDCVSSTINQINFTDEKYLEVFILHWFSELVIEAGEWSVVKSKRNVFCKLDVILEFLKSNKPKLAEELQRIVIRFNYTSNNVTSIERKANVTDDDGLDDNDKVSKYGRQHQDAFNSNSSNGADDRYRVEQDTAGFMLIINQNEFHRDPVRKVSLGWQINYLNICCRYSGIVKPATSVTLVPIRDYDLKI